MRYFRSMAFATLLMLLRGSAQAPLIGETFDGDYGINNSGGPFDPGFVEQVDGGLATVGPGVEYSSFFGPDVDITDTGVTFTGFNSSVSVLPFNGWRFTLQNPSVQITGVTLISTTVAGLDGSNISFVPTGFAVNSESTMNGNLELAITTSPLPEPTGRASLLGAIAILAVVIRHKRK